ncbi:pyruvate dehydrogenase (acetyl-transferring) E1 component subunit alpha [Geobacter hydrogenophilus]|uniref:Pyruvate dehydrogenase E1 component subunit alpha n=1 Tax=Geobacter hydrogenophilus TaxID=40983 RepID=A0A9W6G3X7_9BACT|nr:pyruvate dehydrogenase (acetyl-transferring) E1 component subunit alpha [Geobacter hydrogenophilus]MBT0892452.1 pyruvate dehydrogenase (acetyl-transferring) E1 component subunit alpha [Geobacter hydrogenophilus]GLI39848.1 pyruvate dehydrogenase (acetyl-transferring) E1 component subunit alpha [Geobacter hydrogenophilus]
MPESILATFTVKRLEIIAPDGTADESLVPDLSGDELRRIYYLLLLTRAFDGRALALQREGRIGTYPSVLGQEAAQVGSAFAIHERDWVFPSFREMGAHLTLGYPLHQLYQYWGGDERGLRTPDGMNIFPICVSVGTHIPHAAGAALAAKLRGDRIAVIAYFGDGGTSKGDFHEGFNLAGVMGLPTVFICQNNQWAISVPLSAQTASRSLAQKAVAYGFDGIQVDGNDVLAVYRATREALEKARGGGGPTFIECLTYRMSDHTTSDDASRYRSPEETEQWRERDPILRYERFLAKRGLWNEDYAAEMKGKAGGEIDEAVRRYESVPPPAPGEMFDFVSGELSARQQRQREEASP